jgi:hypothetical protein
MLTFSQRYLYPQVIQDDTPRLRIQLLALFEREARGVTAWKTYDWLRRQTGADVPLIGATQDWEKFFKRGDLRDVLDSVTAVYAVLKSDGSHEAAGRWLRGVEFAFNAQNVKYRVDTDGSVLLRVDDHFQIDRVAALAGMEGQRYQGVRAEFDGAYHALTAEHPNGKQAIRGVFEACEVVFKLMFPGAQRLAAPQLGQHLSPFVAEHYAADRPAQQAADKLIQGFTDWVASAQFYRHGQGQEEPNQPPLEVAITLLSSGASYLRWLIHLDKAKLDAED